MSDSQPPPGSQPITTNMRTGRRAGLARSPWCAVTRQDGGQSLGYLMAVAMIVYLAAVAIESTIYVSVWILTKTIYFAGLINAHCAARLRSLPRIAQAPAPCTAQSIQFRPLVVRNGLFIAHHVITGLTRSKQARTLRSGPFSFSLSNEHHTQPAGFRENRTAVHEGIRFLERSITPFDPNGGFKAIAVA